MQSSSRGKVHIIRTGVANLASVCAAMERAGLEPVITESADEVSRAELCVLPGVGAFAAGMSALRERGVDRAIIERAQADRPLLAVCLGMQLLLDASEEGPGVAGLGLASGVARRFPSTVRVPQFGWNRVTPRDAFDVADAGWAYFANSYRLVEPPTGWSVATSDYAGEFVAAMQRSPRVVACQFHPELSGKWGASLISRWFASSREEVRA